MFRATWYDVLDYSEGSDGSKQLPSSVDSPDGEHSGGLLGGRVWWLADRGLQHTSNQHRL